MRTDLYIEFQGNKTNHKALVEMAKEIWKSEGNKVKDLETMELFFKPEESKCFYVINGQEKGFFEV